MGRCYAYFARAMATWNQEWSWFKVKIRNKSWGDKVADEFHGGFAKKGHEWPLKSRAHAHAPAPA